MLMGMVMILTFLHILEWIMFTNGDNMYNKMWFDIVASNILTSKYKLIGWDFITHHMRPIESRDDVNYAHDRVLASDSIDARQQYVQEAFQQRLSGQQQIRVALRRRYVDLGSVVMHASLLRDLSFLPQGPFTDDLMARDFHLIEQASAQLDSTDILLIHRTLLFHQ